jgi:uncharacterized membrane protein
MPEAELRQKMQTGELLQTDHVWTEGLSDWVPVPRIATVLPPLPAPAPPPRPQPQVEMERPAPQRAEPRPAYPQPAQYQPQPQRLVDPGVQQQPYTDQQATYPQPRAGTEQPHRWTPPPVSAPPPIAAAEFPVLRGDPGTPDAAYSNLQLIYILYLVGTLIPIVGLVGFIIALVNKGKGTSPLADTHYEWLIRSYWMYWAAAAAGLVLLLLIVGYLVLLAALVVWLVRAIMGLQALGRNEGMPMRPLGDVKAWLWG